MTANKKTLIIGFFCLAVIVIIALQFRRQAPTVQTPEPLPEIARQVNDSSLIQDFLAAHSLSSLIDNITVTDGNAAELLLNAPQQFSAAYKRGKATDSAPAHEVELAETAAAKKDFSLFPELANYPQTLAELEFPTLPNLTQQRTLLQRVLILAGNDVQSVFSVTDREKAAASVLLFGQDILMERDYNHPQLIAMALAILDQGSDTMIKLLNDQGKTDQRQQFVDYQTAVRQLAKEYEGISQIDVLRYGMRSLMARLDNMSVEQWRSNPANINADMNGQLTKLKNLREPSLQLAMITGLTLLRFSPDPQEADMANQALTAYSYSAHQLVRDFSRQALIPQGPFDLIELVADLTKYASGR